MREMPAVMGVHHISPRLSYLLFQVSKEFTRLEYQEMLYLKGKKYIPVCDVFAVSVCSPCSWHFACL